MSSSIPSWQILNAHAQPFRGARDLVFCLKVPLDSLLVWASSGGSGETARMRRLAWTFAARIGDKYQIRLTQSIWRTCINNIYTNYITGSENKPTANANHLLYIIICSNDDPRLTVTYFTARSNLVPYAFIWGKTVRKSFNGRNLKQMTRVTEGLC